MNIAKERVANYKSGSLYLRGCDLTGVTLPTSIGDWLDLSGCDLTGVTLPTSIGGTLDLRGCDLTGVTLPTSIGGSLCLRGCDLSGVTLPTSIGGSLDLRDCDLSGVTLPTSIGGWLYLSDCKNIDRANFSHMRKLGRISGTVICARTDYILMRTDDGRYAAGCRGPFTADAALKHWHRIDARALAFTAAIRMVQT